MSVESPHDLYGLPLDRFIPERAALAKALRGEKRRDEAGEVAALRKPSVAAWAVNQLVRTQTDEIRALFEAGDELIRAQADAAAGERVGEVMRDATRRRREVISRLVQAAQGLLSSDGHPLSQTTLERVGDTLRAAAVDEEARRQVQGGCLAHELRFVGLGVGDALAGAPPRPAPKPPAVRRRKASESDADAEVAARQAEADAEAGRARKAALKEARHAEADARQAATRAEKGLAAAQARRDEAAASLEEAEGRLADAEATAERAARELANAERAVSELSAG